MSLLFLAYVFSYSFLCFCPTVLLLSSTVPLRCLRFLRSLPTIPSGCYVPNHLLSISMVPPAIWPSVRQSWRSYHMLCRSRLLISSAIWLCYADLGVAIWFGGSISTTIILTVCHIVAIWPSSTPTSYVFYFAYISYSHLALAYFYSLLIYVS